MARRKQLPKTSVFFTSPEYTSDPTIAQKGTLEPSSCDIAKAMAVCDQSFHLGNAPQPFVITPKTTSTTHFACARWADQQQRPSRVSPHFQQAQMHSQRLSRATLSHETLRHVHRGPIVREAESFDMAVGCYS